MNLTGVPPQTSGPYVQSGRSTIISCLPGISAKLRASGLPETKFNGHSFRMRCDHGSQARSRLGRWWNEAYKTYIKIPRAELANVPRFLAKKIVSFNALPCGYCCIMYVPKLTLLACVNFPPHKPYIVAKHDCAPS